MIRPRPTNHVAADPFGLYTIGTRVEQWGRPPATCPLCGAHLSRYRSLGDTHCSSCAEKLAADIPPYALHPDPTKHERWRHQHRERTNICQCGGKKDERRHQEIPPERLRPLALFRSQLHCGSVRPDRRHTSRLDPGGKHRGIQRREI